MENGTIRWLRGLSEPKLPYDFGCFATGPKRAFQNPGRRADSCLCFGYFVLRTGLPWEWLPQEVFGVSGVTCWRRLRDWTQAGRTRKASTLAASRKPMAPTATCHQNRTGSSARCRGRAVSILRPPPASSTSSVPSPGARAHGGRVISVASMHGSAVGVSRKGRALLPGRCWRRGLHGLVGTQHAQVKPPSRGKGVSRPASLKVVFRYRFSGAKLNRTSVIPRS